MEHHSGAWPFPMMLGVGRSRGGVWAAEGAAGEAAHLDTARCMTSGLAAPLTATSPRLLNTTSLARCGFAILYA